jgi:hypothetical protein
MYQKSGDEDCGELGPAELFTTRGTDRLGNENRDPEGRKWD